MVLIKDLEAQPQSVTAELLLQGCRSSALHAGFTDVDLLMDSSAEFKTHRLPRLELVALALFPQEQKKLANNWAVSGGARRVLGLLASRLDKTVRGLVTRDATFAHSIVERM